MAVARETSSSSAAPAPGTVTAASAELERTWRPPSGIVGWFQPVNQGVIGRRFIVTSLVFLALAGLLAIVMRLQLATPENTLMGPELYNQLLTMHGTTMMFLFAIPAVEGFIIAMVPPMIGARDMPLPRLNAFGYYIYLIGGVTFFGSLALGLAPAAGWFSYVPLASDVYSSGLGVDVWTTMITFIEVSALAAAVEIIVLVLRCRAPGMTLDRMPLFAWSALVTAFMIVFAMPAVIVASAMLYMDRELGTQFFVAAGGGDPLLWQHLFWFFGHPEVYIILVPALGMVSTIIPTFTGRPIFGYPALVLSLVATGFISFGLWVHHMFATGLPHLGLSFFTAASAAIAVPAGVQVFCWIASLWGARPRLATPMLYLLGFFAIFVIGGMTGVMVAAVPFDLQVHDSFFVVAHFHYVLIGGSVFPVFGGLYYWWPKLTGRMMSERAGRWSFGLMFVGVNATFFPMHLLGLWGMPRRVYTYLEAMGWGPLNLLATVGAVVVLVGVGVTFANAAWSLRRGERAGADPWDGGPTLEWAVPSPAPAYNHAQVPVVDDRWPLWRWRECGEVPVVTGMREDRREIVVTCVVDAEVQGVQLLPGPTPWPFLSAAAASMGFIGLLVSPWAFPIGFALASIAFVAWLWPRAETDPVEMGAR